MHVIKYDFTFKGETASGHGVYVEKRPDIPAGKEETDFITIAGRDSPIAVRTGERKNIEIALSCGFLENREMWSAKAREIRKWINGEGELSFADSANFFWKVRDVELKEFVRETKKIGKFDVTFTCDPYEYLKDGLREQDVEKVRYNPYDTAHPTYLITGNGTCTLTVNGKTMKATVGQNLTIDTDRMLAYREDGSIMNTSVNGDYEDLYLQPGENAINITSGFGMKVIPNWRCL